jgi:hypothetical protein
MEPNNLENQFAEKLNAREIQPSPVAWDRLDAMLTVAEKPKRNFNWLYIAASFVGFILIATVFFNQTETLIDIEKNTVVLELPTKENTILKSNVKNQFQKSISNNEEEVDVQKSTSKMNVNNQIQKSIPKINSKNQFQKSIINHKNESINETQIANNVNLKTSSTINQQPTTINHQPTTNTQKPTYVNVDALLAAVEQPTLTPKSEKIFSQKSNVNVNANLLLSQVDGEIELTFREKVIKSVNKNFKTVRVAIANRNIN